MLWLIHPSKSKKIMKFNYLALVAISIFVLCFSCKKDSSDEDKEQFVSYTANGTEYNFDFCVANLSSRIINDKETHFTTIMAGIAANIDDDNIIQPPSLAFSFEGNTTGIYDNTNFSKWLFSIVFHIGDYDYLLPKSLDNVKGWFEINITKYNLDKNIIEGTFEGTIYEFMETDSLVVEKGRFRSRIYDSNDK